MTIDQETLERWDIYLGPIVVSGISAGVPGSRSSVFREDAMDRVIAGENFIENLSEDQLRRQVVRNLGGVADALGEGPVDGAKLRSVEQVVRLAGLAGGFDMAAEFGVRGSVSSLMDVTAKLSLAAAILALKDAGIPLVRQYRKKGSRLIPGAWALPACLGDETGVVMASAFPALDSLVEDVSRFFAAKYAGRPARKVKEIYERMLLLVQNPVDRKELTDWYEGYQAERPLGGTEDDTYTFSRSFLMRIITLGHAQTAQFLRARGPNTTVNVACASATQAVGIAEDWIRSGRAKRVLVVSADDPTSPTLMPWLGTGFLATGAASTCGVVTEAALPFDRRRNGMVMGMGASGMVLEAEGEASARGMEPLAELLGVQFENSAFHMTRMDPEHVQGTMERLLRKVEKRYGLTRSEIAAKMLFMSHETYTPAQGGCSAVEVASLKQVFGEAAGGIVITNTKGFTGHSMGASIEDTVQIRAMNVGRLPPIANFKEPDPDLAGIPLSDGGECEREFAMRLSAGFGSQVVISLMKRRWQVSRPRIQDESAHRDWLRRISGIEEPELETVCNTLRVKEPSKKEEKPKPKPPPPRPRPAGGEVLALRPKPADAPLPSFDKERPVLLLANDPSTAAPFIEAVERAGGEGVAVKPADWTGAEKAGASLRSILKKRRPAGLLDLTPLELPDAAAVTASGFDRAYRRSARALRLAALGLREELRGAWALTVHRTGHALAGWSIGTARELDRSLEGARVASLGFDDHAPVEEIAKVALAEPGTGDPEPELVFDRGRRMVPASSPQEEPPAEAKHKLGGKSVILVAGGGEGAGAALSKALAARHRCPLVVLGGIPLPKEASAWARMSEDELRKTEEELESEETMDVRRSVELHHNIEEMCRSGSKVLYLPADLSSAGDVSRAVKKALRQHGSIDFVIHAAGAGPAPEGADRGLRALAHPAFHLLRAVPQRRGQTWVFVLEGTEETAGSAFLKRLAQHLSSQGRPVMALELPDGPSGPAFKEIISQMEYNVADPVVRLKSGPSGTGTTEPEKETVAA